MPTPDNLQAAFAGESQANRRYLAFALKAKAEGFPQIARLFRAVAEAETVHARTHLRVSGGVRTTAENLQAAIDGEAYEFRQMYPPFADQAKAEGNQAAETGFRYAMAVEEVHHGLYAQALEAARTGQDLPPQHVFVCPVCGYTVTGETPGTCPVCKALKTRFVEIA